MKYAWVTRTRDQFAITRMRRLLGVSRTGYCQWRGRAPSPRSLANTALMCRLRPSTRKAAAATGERELFDNCGQGPCPWA